MTFPWIAPSVLSSPLLPFPTTTEPSGTAFGPRYVRPEWFSNPTSGPSAESTTRLPTKRLRPARVVTSRMPAPGIAAPTSGTYSVPRSW